MCCTEDILWRHHICCTEVTFQDSDQNSHMFMAATVVNNDGTFLYNRLVLLKQKSITEAKE